MDAKSRMQTCRDYAIKATVAGKAQSSKGTACKQASGVWNMASSSMCQEES